MPPLPPTPCKFTGCPGLSRDGSGWCLKHKAHGETKKRKAQKKYQKRRGSSSSRGYGAEWRRIRKAKLTLNPLCEECAQNGCVSRATTVHHRDHDPHNNEDSNLMSMCRECHEIAHGRKRK
ncbi:HNH endonuclease [Maridesulfovibrio ferrireducens]|uniref:HNH endonuclease n=1 Tax=Maridesulfovibrio ferrireducens TaxID=246191 RepID=UPI001A2439DE|nr:HNH endonuclease [Maridesulfovibrio ferrireducens]MBI9110279.1 HNH endonuclease [Maridesulfovibrio ferrireducens]